MLILSFTYGTSYASPEPKTLKEHIAGWVGISDLCNCHSRPKKYQIKLTTYHSSHSSVPHFTSS